MTSDSRQPLASQTYSECDEAIVIGGTGRLSALGVIPFRFDISGVVATENVPLVSDDDDVIRIEGTRVPFETVVETFQEGATPEEIAQRYPSVRLGYISGNRLLSAAQERVRLLRYPQGREAGESSDGQPVALARG